MLLHDLVEFILRDHYTISGQSLYQFISCKAFILVCVDSIEDLPDFLITQKLWWRKRSRNKFRIVNLPIAVYIDLSHDICDVEVWESWGLERLFQLFLVNKAVLIFINFLKIFFDLLDFILVHHLDKHDYSPLLELTPALKLGKALQNVFV